MSGWCIAIARGTPLASRPPASQRQEHSLRKDNTRQSPKTVPFLLSQWPISVGPADVCFDFLTLQTKAALARWAVYLDKSFRDELVSFCGHVSGAQRATHRILKSRLSLPQMGIKPIVRSLGTLRGPLPPTAHVRPPLNFQSKKREEGGTQFLKTDILQEPPKQIWWRSWQCFESSSSLCLLLFLLSLDWPDNWVYNRCLLPPNPLELI